MATLFAATWLPGCGSSVVPPGNTEDGNRDSSVTSILGKTSGEPNDDFEDPVVAVFDGAGVARLQGTISHRGDIDVYLLGALSAGEQVIVDTRTTGSPLDVSAALFDSGERLVYNNDDRGGSSDRFLDSYIKFVVRHGASRYYLAVTHSAFALSGTFTGSYTIDVRVAPGFTVPAPRGQVLLLNFDGADIDSPTLGTRTLARFDAAAISPIYRGDTQTLKNTIRTVFEQNFQRFNVTIITSDDPVSPDQTCDSIIHFGGFNEMAFGISENVDLYNADFCDDALVFTESFDPRVFSSAPSAVELGIAIGNVGSHEAGHLLGLNHVDDDADLMDDQSAADVFIEDQEFMQAPLSRDIMRLGTQDAMMLLNEIVGPSAAKAMKQNPLFSAPWTRVERGPTSVSGRGMVISRRLRAASPKAERSR